MKYTIEGLSQARLVEWGLDATDAVLIRWFADWYLGAGMQKIEVDGKSFGWMNYQHVCDELPCLGLDERRSISRRFEKYIRCGLLETRVKKIYQGTKTYFHIVPEKWFSLTSSTEASKVLCQSTEDRKVPSTEDSKVPSDSSSNDSSIREEGEEHEARTSAAPAAAPSPEPSPPSSLSLIEEMRKQAGEKKVSASFITAAWIDSLGALVAKAGVSETAILRAFRHMLDTRPDKARFFPADYSKYCRELDNSDRAALPTDKRGAEGYCPDCHVRGGHGFKCPQRGGKPLEGVSYRLGDDPRAREQIEQIAANVPWKRAERQAAGNALRETASARTA